MDGVLCCNCPDCMEGRKLRKVQERTIKAMAERIAGQSELLSQRAEKPAGDPRFHAVLKEMGNLHDRKQQDYGVTGDPFANVRASEAWGIPAWQGTMIRACDKIKRLQSFASNGKLANEGVEDSLIDLANYAVIALVLWREQQEKAAVQAA